MARLSAEPDLERTVGRSEAIVEAAVEDLDVKRRLFAAMDATASPVGAPGHEHERPVGRGDRRGDPTSGAGLGLHFFNPAPLMPLVEVVVPSTVDPMIVDDRHRARSALGQDAGPNG